MEYNLICLEIFIRYLSFLKFLVLPNFTDMSLEFSDLTVIHPKIVLKEYEFIDIFITLLKESYQIIYNKNMDHDNLNIEIRKFLKKVGISSQRVIETLIIEKLKSGDINIGDDIELEMKLSINNLKKDHIVAEKIRIK